VTSPALVDATVTSDGVIAVVDGGRNSTASRRPRRSNGPTVTRADMMAYLSAERHAVPPPECAWQLAYVLLSTTCASVMDCC